MSEGEVRCTIADGVATVLFDRPQARNAMTWAMYDGLARACREIAENPDARVAVFRGAGGEAFVAGTDIAQFTEFTAEDGVRYESRIASVIERIETLPKPAIAVVEGWCTGGGLIIAAACDFRIATPSAKFGVPIARTLGTCISIANVARLVAAFGQARVKRILMLAEMVTAEEAAELGFVHSIAAPDTLDGTVADLCARLKAHAPLTMQASKEAMRRLLTSKLPDDEDLVRICYGSTDLKEGIAAFLGKRKPRWTGT
jgi:enoyl-CoA hydratase/carnithine racemase